MMLKEHIAETYGSIRYTIGTGCSGGSIQQYVIAADYPGLLDGIQPNCSFQDSWTTANEVTDCHLLLHYAATHPGALTAAQQAAVMGVRDHGVCTAWDASFAPVGIPSRFQNCNFSAAERGRCRLQPDDEPNRSALRRAGLPVRDLGLPPTDGFARSPYANVGVQYGLNALTAGTITPEQFVALNQARRRSRHRLQLHRGEVGAGSRRAVDRASHRSGHAGHAARERADHRPARLRAPVQRHPHRLPLLRDAGTARRRERRSRQPADLDVGRRDLQHRPAGVGGAEVVPDDGQLARDHRVGSA